MFSSIHFHNFQKYLDYIYTPSRWRPYVLVYSHLYYRARGVEDLQHALLPVHLDLLPVRVLDRRVVLLHEDPLHELDGERRLAHAAGAEDDDLVLAHGCAAVAVGRSAAATGGRLRLLEELMEISIKYLVFLPSMTLFLIYR